MNETIRTIVFVAAGAVAALAAFATRPATVDSTRAAGTGLKKQIEGKPLFPNYTDPLLARSLEIKQFDEGTAKTKNFRVEESAGGVWTIPSHGGYPADAADQLKSVSEQLAGLTVIGLASEEATDHELFGVKDPSTAAVGATGVGTLITLADDKGNELVNLIVGKPREGFPNQHFVRKPKEDIVTVATIDMTKLPTQFDKWIEKDLLKISTFDVSKVTVKDYAILPTPGGMALINRMEAALAYDSSKGEWALERMRVTSREGPKEVKLGEQEELNKQKLDDLRNGLGDVKIVDVKRKPEGLGNSLRINPDQLTRDQQLDLQDVGFFPQPTADGKLDIYGANGEVLVETKDGVIYVLRFGDVADDVDLGPPAKTEDGSPPEEDLSLKIHRYLFVTTQVAPSVLTPPQLEPEPAGPAAETPKPDDAKKADEKSDETKPPVLDPKQAELERIRTENKRKMDEYNDKKKKAEVRVKELNARFADWYYVVSEDVYKKIRLVRSDIVKEKAGAKEEGFGPDAFRSLEQGGVKGASTPPPSTPSFNPGGAFPPM